MGCGNSSVRPGQKKFALRPDQLVVYLSINPRPSKIRCTREEILTACLSRQLRAALYKMETTDCPDQKNIELVQHKPTEMCGHFEERFPVKWTSDWHSLSRVQGNAKLFHFRIYGFCISIAELATLA